MSGSDSAPDIDVGGRSPRSIHGRERERISRRLGLTHSLDSPRATEPAKPELPARIQTKDQLPRPRSVSPRRNQAPPSVSGSSLSAKLERASTVRAKARNVPPVPPPPKTRARFSVKLNAESGSDCDTSSQAGTPATAEAAAAQDEATTPTPGSGSAHVGELTLETDPQQDEAPVVVLPSDITAAQAVSGLGAERRMRDSRRKEQDEDCGGRDRVTGDGGDGDGDGAELVDGRSTGSDFAAAAAVFGGRRRSQIQPAGRPPLLPARPGDTSAHGSISNNRPFRGNSNNNNYSDYDGDEEEEEDGTSPGPGFRRGSASYNSPATPRSRSPSPSRSPAPPTGPAPLSPCGTPAGFIATNIRRARALALADGPPSPSGTDGGGDGGKQAFPITPARRSVSPSSSGAAIQDKKPLPLLQACPSSLPVAPPETPRTNNAPSLTRRPSRDSPELPPRAKQSPSSCPSSLMSRPPRTPPREGSSSCCSPASYSSPARSEPAVALSPGGSSPYRVSRGDLPTPPPKHFSTPASPPQQQQPQQQEEQQFASAQKPLNFKSAVGKSKGAGVNTSSEDAMESDLDFIRELTQYRSRGARAGAAREDAYEFALVLKPNDEYRDAVEVLELALDLRDGAGPGHTTSPQKIDDARRVRESLDGLQPPNLGVADNPPGVFSSQSGSGAARKATPPQVRPGLSEGLEGVGGGGRRQRLSLLDDLQEAEGRLTNRRKKELERKKKHRLFHFAEKMREGIIVRRHLAHRTCDQVVLQSTDDCQTITWKPLLATEGGGGGFLKKFKGPRLNRAESIKPAHIAVVLPATDPDPSHPGFFGTRALRLSEDIANPARTFSLLYGDWGVGSAGAEQLEGAVNGTLDLECDDDGMYAMLFQGFLLLHMQASHVMGGGAMAVTPAITPPAPGVGTPPKGGDSETDTSPGLDNMEAGSGTRGRARGWNLRKSPSSNGGSPPQSDPPVDGKRASITASEEGGGSPPIGGGGGGGSGGRAGGGSVGSRASLRKSLKFLPDLLGGLSQQASRHGRRAHQQTSSQVMGGAPPEFFLGWTSPGTQIWSRLRMAGLEVEKLYSLDRRHVLLKIRLPRSKLEEVAEVMRLKLRRRDGTIGRFKKDHRSSFSQSADGDLFRSGESQKVIDHLIRSKIKDGGSELDDRTELGKHICKRMPLHNQERLDALYNAWVVYWRAPRQAQVHQQEQQRKLKVKMRRRKHQIVKTPIASTAGNASPPRLPGGAAGAGGKGDDEEDYETRSERMRERATDAKQALISAARLSVVVLRGSMWQPLELIADYFGEATAFYFAWMGFYTQGLVVPSIFGVIVFGCQVHSRTLDHPLMPIYAVFVILWSTALFVLWRQRCSELAYRWGVLHFEQEEQTRSQFWGKEQRDNVTGRFVREYPAWKRWATYAVTMPAMVGFTGCVLLAMFMILVKRDGAAGVDRGLDDPDFWAIMLVKPMLYGIMIPILYQICKKLGVFLNNLENHKTENKYRNALIVKVFSFRFATVFATLYHYAFVSTEGTSNYKLMRLAASLCSFMTIGQWWYMIWMCYIPERVQNWKIGKLKAKVATEGRKLKKADADEAAGGGGGGAGEASRSVRRKLLDEAGDHLWEEALLKEYNMADVFDDYTMSLIQFGYVALFSAAFPLAPLLAMINNLVQTRVDAHKICKTRRRPIALKSGGIGVWDNVLELMTVIAVITNCALIGVTSTRWWPSDVSRGTRILVVVIVEHIILFLKYWLEASIPRVPHKVQRALQRERVEREQKGVFADAPGSDYAKFEANFSTAVTGKTATGLSSSSAPSSKTPTTHAGNSATKAVAVNEDLTASTPTPSGRARKGFTVNLSTFATATGSTSASPARSFSTVNDDSTPRCASMSAPRELRSAASSAKFSAPAPPPSAATVRSGPENLSPSPPPPPQKRFNWDSDTEQTL